MKLEPLFYYESLYKTCSTACGIVRVSTVLTTSRVDDLRDETRT
jgi:hypothetical protein